MSNLGRFTLYCSQCKEHKDVSKFTQRGNKVFNTTCKDCCEAYRLEYKERIKKRQRGIYQSKKAMENQK